MELLVVTWLAVGLVLVGRFVEKRWARRGPFAASPEPVSTLAGAPTAAKVRVDPTSAMVVRGLTGIAQALNEERAIEAATDVVKAATRATRATWWTHDRSRDTWSRARGDAAGHDRAADAALGLALRARTTLTRSSSESARHALRDAGALAVVPVFDRALTVGAWVVYGAPGATGAAGTPGAAGAPVAADATDAAVATDAAGAVEPDVATLDAIGAVLGVAIANARLSRQQLDRQVKDPLTGLSSVETLVRSVERSLARGRVSVVLVAMPQMRAINLRYGRQAGDRALAAVARLVALEAGEQAEVGRFGGATLLLVLPGVAAPAAERLIERIAVRVGDTLRAGPQRADEPLCLEAVVADGEGGDAEALLRDAESRLTSRDRMQPRRNEEV